MVLSSISARADVLLSFLMNTSSVAGTTGYLDFQFNPLNSSTLAETATIENFAEATYNPALGSIQTGASGGPVGVSTIVLPNSTPYNDEFDGITYGKSITFVLDLGGPGVNSPNGALSTSEFDFSLFNSAQNSILTSNVNGYALTVDVNANGSVTVTPDSPYVKSTPEPASLGLIGLPLALAAGAYFKRRHNVL